MPNRKSGNTKPPLACVSLAKPPLQVLLAAKPGWREGPVAVLDGEKTTGIVLEVNEAALRFGVDRGMRFGEALALVPELRGATLPKERLRERMDEVFRLLCKFSPAVERCPFEEGVYWLDIRGLAGVFGSVRLWAEAVRRALFEMHLRATVVVGFSRPGTYVRARLPGAPIFVADALAETDYTRNTRLEALPLPPLVLALFQKLALGNLGSLSRLPRGELARRFGEEAAALLCFLLGGDPLPVQGQAVEEPARVSLRIEEPRADLDALVGRLSSLVEGLAAAARERGRAFSRIRVYLRGEDGESRVDDVGMAAPTANAAGFERLLRLRFEYDPPSFPVAFIELEAPLVAPGDGAASLFGEQGREGRAAAERALDLLRARFGEAAVSFFEVRDAHFPEDRFVRRPLVRLPGSARGRKAEVGPASPLPGASRRAPEVFPAVRRYYEAPPSAPPSRGGRRRGPFLLSTGWWGTERRRRYYYDADDSGRLWWVYDNEGDDDGGRAQGRVE